MSGGDQPAPMPTDAADAAALDAAAWAGEFERLVADVEAAAEEWGVERGSVEGRFVSALLGTTRWLGRLCVAAQVRAEAVARGNREATERELAAAREITRSARAGLNQADIMLTVVQVEKENLVAKMIKETLPLFAERLKDVLVIREKRLNDNVKRHNFVTSGLAVLAVLAVGYGLHMWQTWDGMTAINWCVWHQLHATDGQTYCNLTKFSELLK